jgi:hypothetical protein
MKIKYILLPVLILISASLYAQSGDEERFFYGAKADADMQSAAPDDSFSAKGIQYGVILNPVFLYEENDNGKLGTYIINARVWAKTYLWSNSFLYVRGKNSYMGVASQDGIYEGVEADNVADLDLAYLSMNFFTNSVNISGGRKFYSIGTGLVLNGRGDGGEISWYGSIISMKVLGLYTGLLIKDNNPYGLSDKDIAVGAKRAFGGGTLAADFFNQKLYAFGLAQVDKGDEKYNEKTKYDSQYYGGGLEGVLLEDFSYFAEGVYEKGISYIATTKKKSSVKAYAVNSGINWFIPVALNPTLIMQYAYGSGDKYRTNYTGSLRPNDAKGDDTGFIYFGTFSGGYALKPVLSNIHIFRGGLSITPFSWADSIYLKKMSLSGKYSYYMKDKKESPIGDNEAELEKPNIGQGVDASFKWQMFYDLSMYVNYGIFLPGAAFDSSEDARHFVMSGVNFSF